MNLLLPAGLALGVTLPIVVIFYLLKVRRRDEEVSSTFLWNDLIRDLAAHEPLQRLRWNVLLAVQLLALAILAVAVARPFVEQPGEPPVQAVILVDASASMQATDVQPSRFARAVAQARESVAGLPDDSLATVILVAAHPQVLVAATPDRRRADRALQDARPTGASGNMREALLLARSLGGDASTRRIQVFTDGAFTLPPDLPDDLGAVRLVQVGGDSGLSTNVAVTAISNRPDPRDNRRRQVFARVENFSAAPALATLRLEVDGESIEARSVEVPANGSLDQVFEELPAGARAATVAVDGAATNNAFSLDDRGFSILSQRKAAQVLLVSPGNPYLEKVLSLLPGIELYRVPSRRYLAVEADRYDVVIFDDYLPPLLPRGNLLVVNPPERGPIRTNGVVRRPRIGAWDREEPLLQFVDIGNLTVNSARKLDMPRWARPLVSTPDGIPLLSAGQDGDRRIAIIPFDLRQSNLPLSPAFPILASNLLAYLSPSGIVQNAEIRTGEVESLAPLPQVERIRVVQPDQQAADLKNGSGPLSYATTDAPGIYRVQQVVAGGGQTVDDDLFAVNLADRAESDLRARIGSALGSAVIAGGDLTLLRKEGWMLLAALALPLLLFEWLWFHRRV